MIQNKVFDSMQWSTVHDMENKLITYVTFVIKGYKVDADRVDPDGVPIVYLELERVTRVRKMTESEFEELFKTYYSGKTTFDIQLNYVKTPDKKV